jgi:hypothetical protein
MCCAVLCCAALCCAVLCCANRVVWCLSSLLFASLRVFSSSSDAVWIAAGCNDNTVRLWRRGTGQELQCGGYSSKITGLSWNSSSRYLATSGGNQVTIWDFSGKGPAGSTPICCIGLSAEVTSICFQPEVGGWDSTPTPSGTRPGDRIGLLAVGNADGTICLFDLGMYEAGDIRIGKPHLCRPSAKYPDNTAAAVANGGAVAKGGLALDGRPTLTPQEPKRPSLLVSTHTYLYLPPSLPPSLSLYHSTSAAHAEQPRIPYGYHS